MHGPTTYRSGIGIVLINARGLVFAGHRQDGRDPPWQMPQGGMQPGEAPERAAYRELKEELGIDRAAIVAACPQWLCYDYPKATSTKRALLFRGQRHKWFLMRFTGRDEDIAVDTEHAEFSAWRWMTPDEIVANVIGFKQDVYRVVMQQFSPFLGVAKAKKPAPPIPPFLTTPSRQQDFRE